jgi:hypothetical protein
MPDYKTKVATAIYFYDVVVAFEVKLVKIS